ncbi:hypothetical protein BH11PSE3_BH11PSE3_34890 [soil metagenome]
MQTITRVYDSYGQAKTVVADLEAASVASSEINLIANKYVCDETAHIDEPSAAGPGAGVGAALGGTAGLLAGLGILAIPGLGPVVAVGALAAAAVGAAAGAATGGVVGALVSSGLPEEQAHVYCEAVRRGGTMVSVHATDKDAALVEQIMIRHKPIDPTERRVAYTGEGWQRFDPKATPYKPTQAEIERLRLPYTS